MLVMDVGHGLVTVRMTAAECDLLARIVREHEPVGLREDEENNLESIRSALNVSAELAERKLSERFVAFVRR